MPCAVPTGRPPGGTRPPRRVAGRPRLPRPPGIRCPPAAHAGPRRPGRVGGCGSAGRGVPFGPSGGAGRCPGALRPVSDRGRRGGRGRLTPAQGLRGGGDQRSGHAGAAPLDGRARTRAPLDAGRVPQRCRRGGRPGRAGTAHRPVRRGVPAARGRRAARLVGRRTRRTGTQDDHDRPLGLVPDVVERRRQQNPFDEPQAVTGFAPRLGHLSSTSRHQGGHIETLGDIARNHQGRTRRNVTTQAVVSEISHFRLPLAGTEWLEIVHVDDLTELEALVDRMNRVSGAKSNHGEATVLAWAEVHGATEECQDWETLSFRGPATAGKAEPRHRQPDGPRHASLLFPGP